MKAETAQQILDVAQVLVRKRGYSAFSYADISEQIGIRKASIHYHFSSKEDLARALVDRYREVTQQTLRRIKQSTTNPQDHLLQFCQLYRQGLDRDQMCLCGILSAEVSVLPESVQQELGKFFTEMETWLTEVLRQGSETRQLKLQNSPAQEAALLLATVQGAQLIARASDNSEAAFDRIVEVALKVLLVEG